MKTILFEAENLLSVFLLHEHIFFKNKDYETYFYETFNSIFRTLTAKEKLEVMLRMDKINRLPYKFFESEPVVEDIFLLGEMPDEIRYELEEVYV